MNLAIGIDAGNTTTRVGLVDRDTLSCITAFSFPSIAAVERALPAVESLIDEATVRESLPLGLSSCVPALASSLRERLGSVTGIAAVTTVGPSTALPLALAYRDPSTLGPDRIANGLYAMRSYPRRPRIVVSAGTAVTVDGITAEGTLLGGAILPGPSLQFGSLHGGTAALPLVAPESTMPGFPAASTEECIRAGVLLGLGGAVSLLVDKLKAALGKDAVVITCGGAWSAIEKTVSFSSVHAAHCTLIGAALCAR